MARHKVLGNALLLLIIIASYACCDELPVRVKADSLGYDQENGMITASGSVEIFFQDVTIEADSALIDMQSNIATAEGHVKIKRSDYQVRSDSLTYDISSDAALAIDLKTVFYPSEIKANIYVGAHELYDKPDVKSGHYGTLTTCDYDEPHYEIKARWFDYYPDDKLVAYWSILYVGKWPTPLIMPYFIYDIKKKRTPYTFVYGQNDVEGRFLKTTFDYFINRNASGMFLFDTTEIKGPGYGISHDYVLNDQNSGNLYLYKMDEQDTKLSDYVLRWTHNVQLDPFSKLTLIHNSTDIYQIPAGRNYSTESKVTFARDTGSQKQNFNYSASDDKTSFVNTQAFNINNQSGSYNTGFEWSDTKRTLGPLSDSTSDRFYHSQSVFTDDLKLSVNVNYTSYLTDEGYTADEKLEPRVDLTYKGPFYSAKLTQNWYVDYDGDKYKGDKDYEYLEKLPELTVAFNPMDLRYATLNLNLGAARYHEAKFIPTFLRMRNITSNEYSFGARLSRIDPLGFGTTLSEGLELDQYAYELGDQRYQVKESLNLDTSLWGFFTNSASWGRAKVDGNTPFIFETLGDQYEWIKDQITLNYRDKVTWDISAGYNYQNSTYDDIITNLLVIPSPILRVNVRTGWSVEEQMYRDLEGSATLTPWDKFTATGSLQYDMNVGSIIAASTLADFEIGDTWENRWHFKVGSTYDTTMGQLLIRDVAVVKDLHCWEATFTYNDYMKEFTFGMSIKAFPQYPVSFTENPNGNYFNSFMDNMNFEQESPRRY